MARRNPEQPAKNGLQVVTGEQDGHQVVTGNELIN